VSGCLETAVTSGLQHKEVGFSVCTVNVLKHGCLRRNTG